MQNRREKGQVLVVVALALLALLAMVALAVDVGHFYAERRHMQNAADAGALAGAREICFGDPTLAESVAMDYATVRNRAEDAQVTVTGGLSVTVLVSETAETYFGGVIGVNTVNVNAVAAATCGRATSASGLWPVAFEEDDWFMLYDSENGCGDSFYVWDSEKIIDCETYDCDLDDDGRDDILVGGNRGWLDFSVALGPLQDDCVQSGCGASEVACHIESDSGGLLELPVCLPGDSGVKAGVKKAVDTRIGDYVRIPLFEGIGCGSGTSCVDETEKTCPGGLRYCVVSFGCVRVHGWIQSMQVEESDGSGHVNGKAIEVSIDCEGHCQTSVGGTDGQPPEPWELRAVSLTQ